MTHKIGEKTVPSKSVGDYIIQDVIYAPALMHRETLTTPAEDELFCQEGGSGIHNDHRRGCDMEIVQQFISKHEYIIQKYVGRNQHGK